MKRKDESASFGVIGLGRFGLALVESLSSAEREVIAIDRDESRVREARKFTDLAMVVDSLDMESLEETGVQNCDTVIICIAEKVDVSVLATITVLNMKVPNVIAKASSVTHGEVLKRLGAKVVYPERDMAIRLGKGLLYNNFLDSVTLQGNVEVRRIEVTGDLIGTSVVESNIRRKYGINIIAIERGHHTRVDFPVDYRFQAGDGVCVVGNTSSIERFENDMH